MTSSTALTWFARHELRLAWREFGGMVGGRWRARRRSRAVWLIGFAAIMHLVAYAVIGRFAALEQPDKPALIVITACVFLTSALMLSQAIESVTRVFYARADLDLIISSPVTLAEVFSVRIGALALGVIAMALLLAMPFVNILVLGGGARWLAIYGVVIACGLGAAAGGVAVTVTLFRWIGAARTRLAAQVVAAVIGAGFVIALQIAAVLSQDTLSRFTVLTSEAAVAFAPRLDSPLWWPARAALGDGEALLCLVAAGLAILGATMVFCSPRFADHVIRVSATAVAGGRHRARPFRRGTRRQALRRKEFALLRRDPWLVSQTLMQLLYLAPPALMLWRSFSENSTAVTMITPVLVMAAGQLAGGLAWLTICGEDAADLVATAPLPAAAVMGAKIDVVLICIAGVFAPLLLALALVSPAQAAITGLGIAIAAVSATAIQLWFRVQARRSQFRRRQTSSRLATFAEAFSSIGWSATAALALAWPSVALGTGLITCGVLAMAWKISPQRQDRLGQTDHCSGNGTERRACR
jgi:ABC-2 type transport system permease protein